MRTLPLSRGLVALVDDDDYVRASVFKWSVIRAAGPRPYVFRIFRRDGRRENVYLHRWLLDAPTNLQVDHINGNTLDCTRGNLRLATCSQNHMNRRSKVRRKHSPYKGVYFRADLRTRPWYAQIGFEGRTQPLGTFATAEDAARAYNKAAVTLFGSYARLNVVPL